jgi:glucose/arabinose dehydrogenase
MAPILRVTATTLASTFLFSLSSAQDCKFQTLKTSYPSPVTAENWSYGLIANELRRPRGILFDSKGALIVIDSGNGILHFELEDGGGTCLQVRKKTTLLEQDNLNHGPAISKDGRTLFASSSNDVFAWSYDPSKVTIDNSTVQTLVTNMANSGHTSRTLLISDKNPDILLVSRGSAGNDDRGAEDQETGRSQIRAYNISSFTSGSDKKPQPYDYLDGRRLGWGLRNSVGLAEHPETGGIFSVENSADQLHRNGEDIHKDNPGEEMNFHGYLNGSREHQGGNYGYPHCYTLWSTDDFPNLGSLKVGDQFPADRQSRRNKDDTNPTDKECNTDYVAPVLAFQAHTAPLDMKFDEDGNNAYVSFHGSWNREPPVGYQISEIAFEDGQPKDSSRSNSAATPIIYNEKLSNCPDDCFRPVGLAWDPQGRLWFSSDKTGEIFVLNHKKEDSGSSSKGDDSDDDDDNDNSAFSLRPGSAALIVTMAAVVMGGLLA